MADLVYLLITVGFFALAAVFVKACEAIMGPDELAVPAGRDETEPEPLAA
jgi:hypothetical protein